MQRTAAGSFLALTDPGLPVAPELAECLALAAPEPPGEPIGGGLAVRRAAAGYWERRGLPTAPDRVLLGPGPGPLLLAVLAAADGDVLLARPHAAWYAPPARLLGRRVYAVPTPAECGGVPDPVALLETVRRARRDGADPRLVVLALADDPTGTVVPPELLHEVCEAIADAGLLAVSDETYRDLAHDPHTVLLSPGEAMPGHTVVIADLASGLLPAAWPAGMVRLPEEGPAAALLAPVREALSALLASPAVPVAEAATYALAEPIVLKERAAAAVRLHAAVATATWEALTGLGALCPPPRAGFHLYPDLEPLRPALAARGITGSAALEERLPAVLAGHRFGDDPGALRVRVTTSALYGDTAEARDVALLAPDPLSVPHVTEAVADLGRAFAELAVG